MTITDDNLNEIELDKLINQLENAPMMLLTVADISGSIDCTHWFNYWDMISYLDKIDAHYYCVQAI